jgi:hypothetical protein
MARFRRKEHYGVVAVLDALGARLFQGGETTRFLESRKVVLELLAEKADSEAVRLKEEQIATFTFNDTVLIVLKSAKGGPIDDPPLRAFLRVLRKFLTDSMAHSILFRGAFSIGGFLMDEQSNSIMGEAVTDAAAWYDKSDWVGLHATPRTYLDITRRMEGGDHLRDWNSCVVEYDVPMKGAVSVTSKAINWPKMFLMSKSPLCGENETPRQCVLRYLCRHRVPFGTEKKYFETLKFFDHVAVQRAVASSQR